jgi:hypothetical protein
MLAETPDDLDAPLENGVAEAPSTARPPAGVVEP